MLKKYNSYFYRHVFVFLLSAFFVLSGSVLLAQQEYTYQLRQDESSPMWVKAMYAKDADPGVVMKLYDAYYKDNLFVKNQHTQYFKRWISGLSKNVIPNPVYDSIYLQKYFEAKHQRGTSNWSTVGPIDWDHDAAARSYAPGSAHVYTVEQSISNPDFLYAGSANAGVWKSVDHGISWTAQTDDFLTGGVTAIEIDPGNADVVYAELLSNIYKTTNGGSTWQQTGDAGFMALSFNTKDIRCKPNLPQTVFAATSSGLYKSTDSGSNWTSVLTGDVLEIEFHPFNTDTIYAVRNNGDVTEFFSSFNDGSTFTQQSAGWPAPNLGAGEHQKRTELAVTPDAPDKVYALATGSANGGSGLYGVYVSSDLGANWTFQCCGPQPAGPPSAENMNLMAWSDQGLDDGGQYYYDLAFGVSPFDKDSIWVCGVNLWVSGNEGVSFVCPAKWSHSNKPNYVHADIHDLNYMEGTGELWVCGDGGIFLSDDSGDNFYRRNVGIAGSDFWGFGMGHWYGDVMIGGAYHNGTLMKEEDTYINGWICTDGGDGVGGYVNPGLDRQAYSNYNIKDLQGDRTVAPVTRSFQYQPNSTYTVGKSSDLLFHPNYYGTWYSGSGTKLYLTRDNGYSFEVVYDFGVDLASMDISQSDPDVIYASTFPDWWGTKRIYRTLDAGDTWIEVTPPAAILNNTSLWIPYDIAVDPQDPMNVWIARTSMYNGNSGIIGYTIYKSEDGGLTWENISGTAFDGQDPTCILYQKGTDGGVYIGTRTSVYYRNNTMPDWELFSSGLPARTHSVKILPWYRNGVIRNATNRSVWESPFYEPSEPIAMPAVQKNYFFCDRDTAYFTDLSVLSETDVSWEWIFPGGTPSTHSIRNPKVVYKQPGVYDVTLIVHDVNGTDTMTVPQMIVADNRCAIDTTPGSAMLNVAQPAYLMVNDFSYTTQHFTLTAWVKPTGIQNEYSGILINDGTTAGMNFRESNNTIGYHWPGGSWSWDSNLTTPPGEWSYVAMVVQPGSVTIYVNGVSAVHNTSPDPVTFNNIRIGSYKGWASRNYLGEIDEVCVWDRALSEDEIRLMRHLVKDPASDASIIGYYQFDQAASGEVLDKAYGVDGVVTGNASVIPSNVPIGSGTSQILDIQSSGNASFDNGGDLGIGFKSLHPSGKVVVSHLRVHPDTLPNDLSSQGAYWIVNNYGANQFLQGVDSLSFLSAGALSHAMADELDFELFYRPQNDFGATWFSILNDSVVSFSGLEAVIKGFGLSTVKNLGQFIVMRDTVGVGEADVVIHTPNEPNPIVSGGESVSLLVYSNHQALKLPVITTEILGNLGAPDEGQFAFLEDSLAIMYFDGLAWRKLLHESVLLYGASNPPGTFGTISMEGGATNESSLLSLGEGLVKLPVFSSESILDVEDLASGMLAYDSTSSTIRCYNGNAWQPLSSVVTGLPVEVAPATLVPGMAINQDSKYPSSVMEIHPSSGKALLLPKLNPTHIYAPVAGLICFNPSSNKLMFYNGFNWNVLK